MSSSTIAIYSQHLVPPNTSFALCFLGLQGQGESGVQRSPLCPLLVTIFAIFRTYGGFNKPLQSWRFWMDKICPDTCARRWLRRPTRQPNKYWAGPLTGGYHDIISHQLSPHRLAVYARRFITIQVAIDDLWYPTLQYITCVMMGMSAGSHPFSLGKFCGKHNRFL